MVYPYFLVYVGAGLSLSLLVFIWAVRRGQFKDQARARFLPLEEERDPTRPKASRFNRYEAYGLAAMVILGLLASVVLLFFSLFFVDVH